MPESERLLAVVDIDGVLADVRHRLRHVRSTPKDWQSFFAEAPRDPLLTQGAETVAELAAVFDVVYLSGRPEHCRRDTEAWLARHSLPEGRVYLRPHGDRRPARVLKVEILGALSSEQEVAVLVDDDHEVLAAARAAGYDVLPADWMPQQDHEQDDLHKAQEVDGRT